MMEFTITCPVDGAIEVGLEDIDTVVLRGAERADMTFVCPHCGTAITVGAVVPAFLLSAMRALAEEPASDLGGLLVVSGESVDSDVRPSPAQEHRIEAYCEYFRRQLDTVEDVDGALAEIDSSVNAG